jgi:NTP pyrophosphatase (non-canonical NTP hydrolase)
MDVKELQARLAAFAAERGWDELHNPRNLAIALAGEAGMLLDLFRWLTDAQSQRIESKYKREAAEEAIADLLLHTLRLADKLGVDVERAVAKKLAENDANYPPPAPEPVAPAPKVVESKAPVEEKKPVASPKTAEKKAPAPPVEERKVAPPVEEKKVPPPPVEGKKAAPPPVAVAPPEPIAPAPAARETKRAPEPAKPAEKTLPTWLDGIMPARSAAARKKSPAATKAAPEPPPRKAQEVTPAPEAAAPPAVEEIDLMPALGSDEREPVEPPPPARPPEPERYAHLDTETAKVFVKSLAKRVDGAKSDDPLLRELHDEVETLRRTLYSATPKYSWMGDSLVTIRDILEEAATHSVGDELRARD